MCHLNLRWFICNHEPKTIPIGKIKNKKAKYSSCNSCKTNNIIKQIAYTKNTYKIEESKLHHTILFLTFKTNRIHELSWHPCYASFSSQFQHHPNFANQQMYWTITHRLKDQITSYPEHKNYIQNRNCIHKNKLSHHQITYAEQINLKSLP